MYYGDEIGMSNGPVRFEEIQDKSVFSHGNDESVGRDPERTPMQWTAGQNAGFSTAKPWLPVNPACQNVNVESEQNEPDSFLALYRRLLTLRSRYALANTSRSAIQIMTYLLTRDGLAENSMSLSH